MSSGMAPPPQSAPGQLQLPEGTVVTLSENEASGSGEEPLAKPEGSPVISPEVDAPPRAREVSVHI